MTTRHTPGPWVATHDKNQKIARWWIHGDGFFLASVGNGYNSDGVDVTNRGIAALDRADKNSALISAAPDLLDACEAIRAAARKHLTDGDDELFRAIVLADSAIAKARGES